MCGCWGRNPGDTAHRYCTVGQCDSPSKLCCSSNNTPLGRSRNKRRRPLKMKINPFPNANDWARDEYLLFIKQPFLLPRSSSLKNQQWAFFNCSLEQLKRDDFFSHSALVHQSSYNDLVMLQRKPQSKYFAAAPSFSSRDVCFLQPTWWMISLIFIDWNAIKELHTFGVWCDHRHKVAILTGCRWLRQHSWEEAESKKRRF